VIVARPAVLWYTPVYATLLAVNSWYAARRRERSLVNDLAAVLQSCLIVPVVATVAGRPPTTVLPVFVLCLAYFIFVSLPAAGLFAWLLVRAVVLPSRGWSPKRVGLIEMANCALLLVCVCLL